MSPTTPASAGPPGDTVHVMHVIPALAPGGMELALSRVVAGLGPEGFRHSIVALKGTPELRDRFDPSVAIHRMNAGPNDLRLPGRLRRLLRRARPTVIHARNWGAWPDVAIARLTVWPLVPLVFSFHGLDRPGAMPRRRRQAFRVLTQLTTHVFTVSRATKRMLVEDVGLPARRIGVIPNGIDTDRFTPARPRPAAGRLVIGTVGGLTPVKNQAMLIRALAGMVRAGIDAECRLAGRGPEKDDLVRLAGSVQVGDRVRFAGQVEDVPAFLRELDIFALPSDSEAHPNALLEAMACGLPTVATRVGGVPEVLGFGRYGRLIEPGDLDGLVKALTDLSADASERQRLATVGRQRVCQRYSLEQMVREYGRLYRRLAGRGRRQGRPGGARNGRPRSPRVVVLGPLPPRTGGMATVLGLVKDSALARSCRLRLIDNGKSTPQRRSVLTGVAAQMRLLGGVVRRILPGRAELIDIHTCSGFTFWRDCLHMLTARALGCRGVWHIQGGFFEQFASGLGAAGRLFLKHGLQMGSCVVVLSEGWRDRLKGYAPATRWRVVPNGVPIPPDVRKTGDGRPRFLYLGDLGRPKGTRDLISAAAEASRRGFRGTVGLAGPETHVGERRELEERIRELSCESVVSLLGRLSGPERDRALSEADGLVLPSYAEGLPMAILEAMAYALPVIATRVGAIPEIITDGQEGFLIQAGDVEALADRLLRLAEDAELRQRMGTAGRRRAQAEYSLDAMAEKLMGIYAEVLERRRAPGRRAGGRAVVV